MLDKESLIAFYDIATPIHHRAGSVHTNDHSLFPKLELIVGISGLVSDIIKRFGVVSNRELLLRGAELTSPDVKGHLTETVQDCLTFVAFKGPD